MRRAYQTDLSDAEWAYIESHIPTPKAPGRPRVHPLREILDAIFYIVRSGCAWRLLPHDFPPYNLPVRCRTYYAIGLSTEARRETVRKGVLRG